MMTVVQNQESPEGKTERLKCYFSLLAENDEEIWVESKGVSMLPLFYRGVNVCIDPAREDFEVGSIVVFYRENKYIAHRIISYLPEKDTFSTKGDTLFFFDPPVKRDELLGMVVKIKKGNREIPVCSNEKISKLSGKLGKILENKLRWLPDWLKFLYYFFFFIPGYLKMSLQKENDKKSLEFTE